MKERTRKLVFYGSLAILLATALLLVRYLYVRAHEADVYESLKDTVVTTPAPQASQDAAQAGTPAAAPHICPVDFQELHAISTDICAWIEVPGMDIAYPVLQSPTDDNLYLRHDVNKDYNDHGAIYSEASVDAADFSDYFTILYGHNFEDGTMFSNLTRYRDSSVLQQNREVFIYTPEKELRYRIFAAVTYDSSYIPEYYAETVPESRQLFLDDLPQVVRDMSNNVLDDVEVTTDDRLLILSTCTGNEDRLNHRYLVVAKLEEENEWDSPVPAA